MGPNPLPQMNAKCDVVMKLSVFGTRTDTHTHTHKAKPINPRYAGCNNTLHTQWTCVTTSQPTQARIV